MLVQIVLVFIFGYFSEVMERLKVAQVSYF